LTKLGKKIFYFLPKITHLGVILCEKSIARTPLQPESCRKMVKIRQKRPRMDVIRFSREMKKYPLMHPWMVVFGEFSPFFCSFQVAGVRAKKIFLPSLVNVKWWQPGELAPEVL
jgi:hypothetical protein